MPAIPKPAPSKPSTQVDYVRDEVKDLLPKWKLIKDCLEGSFAIKAEGPTYLVMPNASDTSPENLARFKARLQRAVFYNVTGRTHSGLVGQVFSKDPSAELPPTLEPFINDVDGSGVQLDQQAKRALELVLAFGRAGLLVDYPTRNDATGSAVPTTRQELLDGNVRPTLLLYEPQAVINWRIKSVGSKVLLSLVVLAETYLESDDGFCPTYKPQYRVLRLDEAGDYTVEIYKQTENGWASDGAIAVLDAKGLPLKTIPFTFIGSANNEATPDLPPLLDIAILNVAHFNNSADNEDTTYLVGQPMYYFSGLTEHWVKNVLGGSIQVGSSKAVTLPENASGGILQATPNTMAKDGMVHKEDQMKALGAKLVEAKGTQKTATEAGADEASETSVLTSAANNVSAAYTQALIFAANFVGETVTDNSLAYALNTDLQVSRMTSQDRAQLVAEWQAGGMDWEEYRWNMRRAGLVYKDDQEVKDAVEAELAAAALLAPDPVDPATGLPVAPDPNAAPAE